MAEKAPALDRPASPWDLFLAFSGLALQGFGGVIAVAQRVLCERRRWLSDGEFVELLSVAQMLPGPNVCNLSLMIGDRFFGWRGAFAALAGMTLAPLVIVLVLAAWFADAGAHPAVTRALHGMGIVAAGLVAGTGLKLAAALRGNRLGRVGCAALGLVTFAAVAVARLPLYLVLPGLGLTAWLWAWHIHGQAGPTAPAGNQP